MFPTSPPRGRPPRPQPASHASLEQNVIDFGRLLRTYEFQVSPAEVQDALRALAVVDVSDRAEFYLTLRSVMLWDPPRQPAFDHLFRAFWGGEVDGAIMQMEEEMRQAESSAQQDQQAASTELAYSPVEALVQKDFSDFRADELAAVARACVVIARKVATRRSRRFRPTSHGARIDPRRTLRRNLKYGGTVLDLARLERKIKKPRLVLICDVSRSMEQYSVFLLQFIHSMQNVIGRVESFVFSTSLHRVSSYFKHSDIHTAIEDIAHEIPDWSGGTRIGASLTRFNEDYGRRLMDRRTTLIVLSDGLDTGQVDVLAEQMQVLRQRAGRIIWLNPLLERRDPRPLARGMLAALPYVDVLAPAHNLASLERLAEQLSGIRRRAGGPLIG